jgi:hypothetical protein
MISNGCLWLVLAGGVSSVALAQGVPRAAAIPGDPLELAAGAVAAAPSPAMRTAALQLLGRARGNYALRSAGRGYTGRAYDLKATFTVNSGGQTGLDGAWKMEDMFDPNLGFRWTAQGPGGYAITRIRAKDGMLYGDETGSYVPLRLQQARAALFDPLPAQDTLSRASIRTLTGSLNGAELSCALSGPPKASNTGGRHWDEAEECIDPQTGLLATHSQVPGLYFAYDYTDARRFDGRVLPGKVTVTEGGKTVITISVDSLTALDAADPSLFTPSGEMKANGRPIALGGARKMAGPPGPGATAGTVCVFGVVTPAGELMEAHSLQPSDPNSRAAVEAAKQMTFPRPPLGVAAQQYFVYILERFTSPQ